MANTACYDPLHKCIKLPPASSEGGAVLEGSIIEMDSPSFQPGRLLLGEIVEIGESFDIFVVACCLPMQRYHLY